MTTATQTRIPEGARVVYVGGDAEHNDSLVGKFGTVKIDDKTSLPFYVAFDHDDSWWCGETALLRVPAVGDTVVAVVVPAIPRLDGRQARVTDVAYLGTRRVQIRGEFQSISKPDDSESFVFEEWTPLDEADTRVPVGYVPTVGERVWISGYLTDEGVKDGVNYTATVTKIEGDLWSVYTAPLGHVLTGPGYVMPVDPADGHTLTVSDPIVETDVVEEPMVPRRELDRANERVEEYAQRAAKWERDFGRYADAIVEEAIERDWCSEYERVMRRIEGDLEIATIPAREEDVDIEWDETYTVTVRRSGTVTMTRGYGSDDLEEKARSLNGDGDASRDEIIQAVRDGNYESCEFVDDSTEEV